LSQLARIHLLLGDLDTAERHAHAAREIHESLGLKEAWKDYNTLAEIAQARGDTRAAAEWAQKRDDLRAELKRRAGGGGGMNAQMVKALQQLAIACAQAGFGDGDLGPNEEEALATLTSYPAPLPDFAAHLRQLAAGQLPPTPASLPAELRQMPGTTGPGDPGSPGRLSRRARSVFYFYDYSFSVTLWLIGIFGLDGAERLPDPRAVVDSISRLTRDKPVSSARRVSAGPGRCPLGSWHSWGI
jgi:hypothetical protein